MGISNVDEFLGAIHTMEPGNTIQVNDSATIVFNVPTMVNGASASPGLRDMVNKTISQIVDNCNSITEDGSKRVEALVNQMVSD